MTIGRRLFIIVMLSWLVPVSLISPVKAEDADQVLLRQEIEEIHRRLDTMQTELDQLKKERGAVPATSPTATAVAPAASSASVLAPLESAQTPIPPAAADSLGRRDTLKIRWDDIKNGMSDADIRQLLGAPSREFMLNGQPVWYYAYPDIGNGSVMFGRDGHTVVGWQPPPFGFW